MITKQEATKKGKELLARMTTKGWKLRIWENLGWHYSLERPPLSIHTSGLHDEKVYVLMADEADKAGWGYPPWGSSPSFDDPNEAVEKQINDAQKYVNQLCKCLQKAIDAARKP